MTTNVLKGLIATYSENHYELYKINMEKVQIYYS